MQWNRLSRSGIAGPAREQPWSIGWLVAAAALLAFWPAACAEDAVQPTLEPEGQLPVPARAGYAAVAPNRQPVVIRPIPRQPLLLDQSISIDLLDHFRDPDGDSLGFAAYSSDDAVASASISGAMAAIAVSGTGKAEITIVAQDPGDLSTSQSFVVTVPANPEREALIALYEATDGPNWVDRKNWLGGAPLRSWEGVSTDRDGRVTRLVLPTNNLVGRIPPELVWLTRLTELNLFANNLRGAVPPELGQLVGLEELYLQRNSLTGAIPPELGGLAELTVLDLADNALTGAIPPELGNLSKLEILLLANNALTGSLPPELGRLANLKTLWLDRNNLAGSIPSALGRLRNLVSLNLSRNRLEGAIPSQLGQLRRLDYLELGGNNLADSIPPELGRLRNARMLDLRSNKLTGAIPPELGNMVRLETLFLDHNLLTGPLPPELGRLRNLDVLWVHNNLLTGQVPATFGQLRKLSYLSLSETSLSGPLPQSLTRLNRLSTVYIEGTDGICVPGVAAFAAWMETHTDHPLCNETDVAGLTALFESANGRDWTDRRGWLAGPALEGWHGVVADSVGKVLQIDLRDNALAGSLPSGLGLSLDRLTVLRIGENDLSGPIPRSLAGLQLEELEYADTDLCVPRGESFSAWLDAIPMRTGDRNDCPALSDRDILVALHEATDGENWTSRENWLTDAPLDDWFGVSVDGEGRVTQINLPDNGLSGALPPELGELSTLERLVLGSNRLTGAIPPGLGNLAELERLDLNDNRITGTIPPQLGSLESLATLNLGSNKLTGQIPRQLGLLAALRRLDLSVNDLSGSIPLDLGGLGALNYLTLAGNRLAGRIPAALGDLSVLQDLDLADNRLDGPIPPELGKLGALISLQLYRNRLTGSIPPELGRLANLDLITLAENGLTGPIPPELTGLANLTYLDAGRNALAGPIPPELGALPKLQTLLLSENRLAGPIPVETWTLGTLRRLRLDDNELTGSLPPEVGDLADLRTLDLSLNGGLGGPLPPSLTQLRDLRELDVAGTGFCMADQPEMRRWLNRIGDGGRIALCDGRARAYLTQAVQSRQFPVPLVAGEEALLRVFPTAWKVNRERLPPVRATFFVDGREVYSAEIAGRSGPIPTRVEESSLENSVNAAIPGSVIQPGLEMAIEVDPEGTLDPSLGVGRRIPMTGSLAAEVVEMPTLDLTLVPFLWTEDPDSTIIGIVRAMAADPEGHELLWDARTLLPVKELGVTAHEPVLSSTNNAWRLFYQTEAIRALEGANGHYMGMMAGEGTGVAGLGYQPGRVSFSRPDASVIVHELGHNMNLGHAPCGSPNAIDPEFPQIDGSIGAPGYDFRDGGALVDAFTSDLMSYCDPHWISEYGFSTALHYRLRTEGPDMALARPAKSLLLWGGVDTDGAPFLESAFVVNAPPRLPPAGVDYRLEGLDAAGRALFSLTFEIAAVADGEGVGSFAFVLPVQPEWEGALATIRLSGPGGSATVSENGDDAAAILLASRNGQVRGILRGLAGDPRIQADALPGGSDRPSLEILFSRGVPDAAAWRR